MLYKKLLRVFKYLFTFFLGAVLLLFLLSRTDILRRSAAGYAERGVSGAIRGDLSIGRLRGNLINSLILEEVSISLDGDEFIYASRVSLSYSLTRLLGSPAVIDRVKVEGLTARLEEGDRTLGEALSPDPEETAAPGNGLPSLRFPRISVEGARVLGVPLEGAEELIISSLACALTLDETAALDISRISLADPVELDISGSAEISDKLFLKDLRVESGESLIQVDGRISPDTGEAGIELGITRLKAGDLKRVAGVEVPFEEVSGRIGVEGSLSEFSAEFLLSPDRARVQGMVSGDISRADISFETEFEDLDIYRAFPDMEGSLTGAAGGRLRGLTPGELSLEVSASLRDSVAGSFSIYEASLRADIEKSFINKLEGDISAPEGYLEFEVSGEAGRYMGSEKDPEVKGRVYGRNLDLTDYAGAETRLNFSSEFLFRSPDDISGVLSAKDSVAAGYPVDSLETELSRRSGVVEFKHLDMRSMGLRLTGSGRAVPEADIDFELSGSVGEAAGFFGVEGSGKVSLSGKMRGDFEDPEVEVSLEGRELDWSGISAGEVSASVSGRISPAFFPEAVVKAEAFEIKIYGREIERISFEADGSKGSAGVSVFAEFPGERSFETRFTASGDPLSFSAEIGKLVLRLRDLSAYIEEPALITLDEKGLGVKGFRLRGPEGGLLSISGTLSPEQENDFLVKAEDIALERALALSGSGVPVSGKVSALFELSGTASAPEAEGLFGVSRAQAAGYGFDDISGSFELSGGDFDFTLSGVKDGRRVFEGEGGIPLGFTGPGGELRFPPETGPIRARFKADDFDLSLMEALTESLEDVRGRLDLDIGVEGDIMAPTFSGKLSVRRGSAGVPSAGIRYRRVEVSAAFKENRVVLENLEMESAGKLTAGGLIYLDGFSVTRTDLDFELNRFRPVNLRSFTGLLSGDMSLSGPADDMLLSGALVIVESGIYISRLGRERIREIEIIDKDEAVAEPRLEPPVPLRLDLGVNIPGNTWVRGEGLDAEIRGNIRVRGTAREPAPRGSLSFARGTFERHGVRLMVESGELVFTGGPPSEAELEIRTYRRIGDVTAYLNIEGFLEEPRITLSSVPPMDESDVLSYIIFGKPASRLTTPEGTALPRVASGVLRGIAERGITDILGPEFAPDVIEIDPGEKGRIGVGTYLTDRLFLMYEWRAEVDESPRTRLEYRLTDRFNIRSVFGSRTASGLDLFWSYSY